MLLYILQIIQIFDSYSLCHFHFLFSFYFFHLLRVVRFPEHVDDSWLAKMVGILSRDNKFQSSNTAKVMKSEVKY
ncbi:unnamed protein product [Brugia timori]|uniref:Ovule protein n=1 Tax=Brugia timori TaxID=42155 RepID=A0A0R3QT34_9BILA|nr:unnamed protein product [Brugia timori]